MAQSTMARSPLGVNFFWEKGHQPEIEWEKWLATVKLAIMVKENIQVDKLLQPRPESEDLDYPTEPHYEPALPDETTAERRQREQRNVKRRTDWQNSCKDIEDKGPQVDNIPWEEADNKTKSHIYLSLGTRATNIFHQRFPHTDIQKCTTDALVEQLRESFIQTRNETFDRYQFFRCRQKESESLEIIQEIKLIPNTTTKIAPFTAHFGRKPNTPISNITSRTSPKNLSYNEITKFHLDKRRGLKQPTLKAGTIWTLKSDSEPQLDIQFQPTIEGDDSSDQSTLQNIKKKAIKRKKTSPIKITPDKLMITFGNKTTSITNTRKQIARKTIARKAPEPRGTLKPLWNIIPDGTITNYSPTTITLDTNTRKNTVIRKNDLAIINETKPRLMHFVACKTVREYNRNQEKIKQFLLTEKKQFKQSKQKDQLDRPEEPTNINEAHLYSQPGPSHQLDILGPNNRNPPQRKRKQQPTKKSTKPKSDFDRKSKETAIAQSKLIKAKERQRKISKSPRIQMDTSKLEQNKSIEVINLISDSS